MKETVEKLNGSLKLQKNINALVNEMEKVQEDKQQV